MAESVKNNRKAAVEFHHRFGGDNGVVDRPSEISPEAADCFSKMEKADRKAVLNSIGSIGKPGQSIFDNKILAKLIRELEDSPHVDAGGAIGQILYYCNNQAPKDLPPFVKISEADSHSSSSVKSNLEYIYLLVNRGQLPLPVIVSADMLSGFKHPRIEVDGYVDSIMIVTKSKTRDVIVGGKNCKPEDKERIGIGTKWCKNNMLALSHSAHGLLSIPCFKKKDHLFPQVVLDSLTPSSVQSLEYFLSDDMLNDMLSRNRPESLSLKSRIPIDIGGYKIEINHLGLERLSVLGIHEPIGRIKHVKFYLQGPKGRLASIPNLNKKLTSIHKGIIDAQDMLWDGGVRDARIIAHSRNQAFCDWHKHYVGFTTTNIARSAEGVLYLGSRHETLHILTYLLGLPQNSEILSYYLGKLDGEEINPFFLSTSVPHPFLKFITERNYFDAPGAGGHPQTNILEFCVSFTNTLFDYKHLVRKLSELPPKQKTEFLDHYINLTRLFGRAANKSDARRFFYITYADLATLRTKWEESGRLSDAGRREGGRRVGSTRPGETIYLSSIEELNARVRVARKNGRRTYVLVYALWCEPCRRFMPRFIESAAESNDQFLMLSKDDIPEGHALDPGGIPTVLIYSGTGWTTRPKKIGAYTLANLWSVGLQWYPDIYWP